WLLAFVAAGIAMVLVWIRLVRCSLRATGPTGAAWVLGRWPWIARGAGLGAAVAALYVITCWVCSELIGVQAPHGDGWPLLEMSRNIGLQQGTWVVLSVLVAPPVEELLFRGVAYGGYRKSLGPIWAAVLTTGIFRPA